MSLFNQLHVIFSVPILGYNIFATYAQYTNEDKVIMKHKRKSLLHDNNEPWVKKKDSRCLM